MAITMTAPNLQPFFTVVARSNTAYVANGAGTITNVANGDINDLENAGCTTWSPSSLFLSGVTNVLPSNTIRLRKAMANVVAGVVPAGPFICIGDSTIRNSAGAVTYDKSWPHLLAQLLNKNGISARDDSIFGASNSANIAAFVAYDTRVTAGTGWTLGQRTAGGQYFKWPGSLTPAAFGFTPANAFNQVDIYYISNTGAQTLNIDRNGSAPTTGGSTLNTNAALGANKATFSWNTVATGPLNLTPGSSGSAQAFILAVICRDTTAPHLDIINMGWAGSNSADWVSPTFAPQYDPLTLIKLLSPVAGVIGHYVNDANSGTSDGGSVAPTSLSAYTANLTAIAQAIQVTGDAILSNGPQSNPANFATAAFAQTYIAALQSLSVSLGIPFFDRQIVPGGFIAANAAGIMADDRHGSPAYSGQDARSVFKLLTQF